MKIQKLRSIRASNKKPVRICYARNGHRLWEGMKKDIPEEFKDYYVFTKINNPRYTYIEIVEDTIWFE